MLYLFYARQAILYVLFYDVLLLTDFQKLNPPIQFYFLFRIDQENEGASPSVISIMTFARLVSIVLYFAISHFLSPMGVISSSYVFRSFLVSKRFSTL
jgi:hypothetical protein